MQRYKCFLGGAVSCALIGLSAFAQSTPSSHGRRMIDPGPDNTPVNEPVIAGQLSDGGESTIMVIWQVQDVPGPGEVEVPVRFEYATAVFDSMLNEWVFTDRGVVPEPIEIMEHFDPTVAAGGKTATGSAGYVGAGAGLVPDGPIEVPNAFLLRTPAGGLIFDPLLSETFDDCIVRYTKIGAEDIGSQTTQTRFHLLAISLEDLTGCGELGQALLRRSENNGITWSMWLPVTDENGPVIGFPSKPVLVPELLISSAQSYFSYLDDQALHIRVARAQDAAIPAWNDAGLTVTPNLPVNQGQTYFDVAKSYVAGNFEIGPFTSIAVGQDGETMYVVYQDLAGAPQGNDGDFDIFISRRLFNSQTGLYEWKSPKKVNLDAAHVKNDQFMPVVAVDYEGRIHVAWLDTRHDRRSPGQDVTIALYYAYSTDQGETFTEMMLDNQIIKTEYLENEFFIGDGLDMVIRENSVLITAMGTSHVRISGAQQQFGGIGGGGGGNPPQENEAIYLYRVNW